MMVDIYLIDLVNCLLRAVTKAKVRKEIIIVCIGFVRRSLLCYYTHFSSCAPKRKISCLACLNMYETAYGMVALKPQHFQRVPSPNATNNNKNHVWTSMQLTIKVNNFVYFAHIRFNVASFSAKKTATLKKKNFLFFTSFFSSYFFCVLFHLARFIIKKTKMYC